jgi:MFS family permease
MSQIGGEKRYASAGQAYWLGVVNGVLFNTGVGFVDPTTVLPTFVARVGGSDLAVGLLSAIGNGGWFLPQLLGASHVQSQPYKRPMYVFTTCLRVVAWVCLIPLVYLLAGQRPTAALVGFMLCYSLDAFAGGLAGPAWLDIIAKTVPAHRLGAFFAHRMFWGGLGAIGSGLLVRAILGPGGPKFPGNYCLLFGLAVGLFFPGWLVFMAIREPPGRVAQPQPLLRFLRGAPSVIRGNREYRLLLISRLLVGSVGLAFPFYIIYCRRALGVPESAVGTYLALQMAGMVVANPLCAHVNDRKGPRALVVASAVAYFTSPAVALVAALLPNAAGFGRAAFGLVFFLLAAAGSGAFIGYTNHLLAIAPEEARPIYIGVQNTLFALTTFLPLLGGVLLRFGSFRLLFGLATLLGMAGAVVALRLPPRGRSQPG